MKITIDYISDIHEDSFENASADSLINELWKEKEEIGEILFILGDLSESINGVINFLSRLRKLKKYKKIYYVPGNHDLHKEGYIWTLEEKHAALKKAVSKINKNVVFLDGQIEEYKGIKISGSVMWYDTSYLKHKYPKLNNKQIKSMFMEMWLGKMRDAGKTKSDPLEFFQREKKKLIKVHDKVDIFASHINPVPFDSNLDIFFRGVDDNTFFCFNGVEELKHGTIKHFLYGHTHKRFTGKVFNTNLYCNPSGYPFENLDIGVLSFEVKVPEK